MIDVYHPPRVNETSLGDERSIEDSSGVFGETRLSQRLNGLRLLLRTHTSPKETKAVLYTPYADRPGKLMKVKPILRNLGLEGNLALDGSWTEPRNFEGVDASVSFKDRTNLVGRVAGLSFFAYAGVGLGLTCGTCGKFPFFAIYNSVVGNEDSLLNYLTIPSVGIAAIFGGLLAFQGYKMLFGNKRKSDFNDVAQNFRSYERAYARSSDILHELGNPDDEKIRERFNEAKITMSGVLSHLHSLANGEVTYDHETMEGEKITLRFKAPGFYVRMKAPERAAIDHAVGRLLAA